MDFTCPTYDPICRTNEAHTRILSHSFISSTHNVAVGAIELMCNENQNIWLHVKYPYS